MRIEGSESSRLVYRGVFEGDAVEDEVAEDADCDDHQCGLKA